jgi:UDP-N-acetylglucosamine--N-acetylmuramyl-(pentapeptide) pyrophosphoryl-undecaprenol N-acetylglucosamine transferase
MFPAQALAKDLKERGYLVHLIGANLESNSYLHKDEFTFTTISSSNLHAGNLLLFCRKAFDLVVGFFQACVFIQAYKPSVVIGFGSFHSFTALAAAVFFRKKIIIFESNAWPGKVNRIFSRFSTFNAVQFSKTANILKGKNVFVQVPFWCKDADLTVSKDDALSYYGLSKNKKTILIFGGSQGAKALNETVVSSIQDLSNQLDDIQVLHFTGHMIDPTTVRNLYEQFGISCCIKPFEEKMSYAWAAADICICRAGAATVSEIIKFNVPSILIPFPRAAENHQFINAQELYKIGGAFYIEEKYVNTTSMSDMLKNILSENTPFTMSSALMQFKNSLGSNSLSFFVHNLLNKQG